MIASLDDTEIRLQSGEGVVRNLGLCSRNRCQKRTLTRIGEAHQTNICQDLQLENKCTLGTILTRLCIARSLICSGLEVPVAQTSATTLQQYELLVLRSNLANYLGVGLASLLVSKYLLGNRSEGYGDNDILRILTRRTSTRATLTILGELVTLILEVDQGPILALTLQNDAAALATIATIGASESNSYAVGYIYKKKVWS